MPKVSVIVPVYNVENYIHRCIDSIMNQTFTDFELILVDDGSPDNCGAICDEYAAKDSRIIVIHKENGGVSSAKNTGIECSTGEYLFFVDSDDYIENDLLLTLVYNIENNSSDLVTIGYTEVNEDNKKMRTYYPEPGLFHIGSFQEKYNHIFCNILVFKTSWGMFKLFKSDIVKENQIRVCETCENFAEDLGFLLTYLIHCDSICSVEYAGYYYFRRNDSMMGISKDRVRLNSMNEVAYYVWKHLKCMNGSQWIIIRFPLLHFILVNNEISKRYRAGDLQGLSEECDRIINKSWYNIMAMKSLRFRKDILKKYGKDKAIWCLRVYYYTVHRSKKILLFCEIITEKIHRMGKVCQK